MRKTTFWISYSAISFLGISSAADAQSVAPSIQTDANREAIANERTKIVAEDGPASRSAKGGVVPEIELETSEDGSAATLTLGAGGTRAKPIRQSETEFLVSRQRLVLKITVPITKSDGQKGSVFSFGSLGNIEKAVFGFTGYSSRIRNGLGASKIKERAVDMCVTKTAQNLVGDIGFAATRTAFLNSYKLARASARGGDEVPDILLDATQDGENAPLADKAYQPIRSALLLECVTSVSDGIGFVSKQLGTVEATAYRESFFTKHPITFYGADATIGQNSQKFLDILSFSEKSDTSTDWEASAYVGRISADYRWAARAKISYVRKHEAGADSQICRPSVANAGLQDCLNGPIGLPIRKDSGVASLELRRRIDILLGDKSLPIGIAPQFTYDIDEKEYGIDVPIYLTANKEGKLTGGLRLGYRSDTKDFGAGIFVGIPFQVPF